jgi:hypothetical protein
MKKLTKSQQKWVDALRSGNYKQGWNYLRQGDRYCCLGVGCEVLELKRGEVKGGACYAYGADRGDVSLSPIELREELKIDGSGSFKTAVIKKGIEHLTLTALNDSGNFTFLQIADIIEEKFKQGDFI